MVTDLESNDAIKYGFRPSTSKETTFLSDTTIGRTLRLCGAMGVITKFPDPGEITGHPQLKE